jgi:hypothetical protein
MNKVAKFFLAALLVTAASYPARLWADWSWTELLTTAATVDGNPIPLDVVHARVALKGDMAKIEDRDQAGVRYYNFANQNAVFLSLKNKTFMTVPFRDLLEQARAEQAGVRNRLDTAEAAADSNLNLTSARISKAQVQGERRRLALEGLPFRLEATQETQTLVGHPCRRYRGYAGSNNYLELWVAEDLKPDPAFRRYAESQVKLDPLGSQHLLATPGFPLRAVFHYGPVEVDWEVESLSLTPLPLDEFLLPPGVQPALP